MMHFIQRLRVLRQTQGRNYTVPLTLNDMPRPVCLPLFGTKLDLMAKGGGIKLHEYIDCRHKNLGPIFSEKLGGETDLVFTSNPILIRSLFVNLEGKYPAHILPEPWVLYEKLYGSKRGLFFMNGEEWLNNRRLMNKHLLKEGNEYWLETPIKHTIGKFIKKLINNAANGSLVPDLESEFYKLSIDVIIAVMLGSDARINADKHYEALLNLFSESVKQIFKTTTKLYGLPVNFCQRYDLPVWRKFKESVDLSLYLAHKLVNEIISSKTNSCGLVKLLAAESVADRDIKRLMGDFIIAAGDTTSYTSLWTLYLLSRCTYQIREIRNSPSKINYAVKESMRLYPVAPFLTRILPKDSILGNYKVAARTPIIASIYTSGRDEANFSRPEEFLPYRWDRNDERRKDLKNHVSSASLPFALGARSCIGRKLAMLQITELMNQIVQNFDVECLNKSMVHANTSQVLVPDTDIKLLFTLRNSVNNEN